MLECEDNGGRKVIIIAESHLSQWRMLGGISVTPEVTVGQAGLREVTGEEATVTGTGRTESVCLVRLSGGIDHVLCNFSAL